MRTSVPAETAGHGAAEDSGGIRLGLGANLGQFSLLVAVNALVGGMVGQERTVLPLLAGEVFGLAALRAALTFIVAFGLTKAVTNCAAGALSDRYGRKPVLVASWGVGFPVPLLLIWAPDWGWIVLAMGLNEAAGYGAVALTAFATGLIAERWGLRPAPFLLGPRLRRARSWPFDDLRPRDARPRPSRGRRARGERAPPRRAHDTTAVRPDELSRAGALRRQAGGPREYLNDGLVWGLLPIYYAAAGLSVAEIGALAAIYPAVWGLGQLVTGALSDQVGRKGLIVGGMLIQAAAIALIAATRGFGPCAAAAAALLGAGTAMVYPTLLAVIGDVAHPAWRASAVGVYRLWRDAGFAVGALLAGEIADRLGMPAAIWAVAPLTGASGLVVLVWMYETHPPEHRGAP